MENDIKMTPRDLMRAQYVNRWQIVPTSRPQNVAQHSWAVAILAMELWLRRSGGKPGEAATDVELGQLALAAIWHDAPEVFTGDVATPTKLYMNASDKLEQLENTAGASYVAAMHGKDDLLYICVKIADFLEAIYWLVAHGDGMYARDQLHGLDQRLTEFLDEKAPLWRDSTYSLRHDLLNPDAETSAFQRTNYLMAGRGNEKI